MRPADLRLVEVEWIDSISHCDSPWRSMEELHKSATTGLCHTAGYLFSEDDKQVTVVLSKGEDEVGMAITIPKVSVLRIHDLTRRSSMIVTM